jgi:hypothetical protein
MSLLRTSTDEALHCYVKRTIAQHVLPHYSVFHEKLHWTAVGAGVSVAMMGLMGSCIKVGISLQ